jgi:hypothetical protein
MLRKPSRWRSTRAVIALGVAFALAFGAIAVSPSTAASSLTITSIWKAIKKKTDKRYYTKAKSDARYAKKPSVIRGSYVWTLSDAAGSRVGVSPLEFGITLPAPPTAHVIKLGDPVPAGCSGTPNFPSASPGHLCIFEGSQMNRNVLGVTDGENNVGVSDRYGAIIYGYPAGAGYAVSSGSWAVGVGPTSAWAKSPAPAQKSGSGLLPR